MNRPIPRFAVLIILSITLFISCTKTHQLHDYPSNYRILGFDESTTVGPAGSPVVFNENYRFLYDGYNRVRQIIYTTSDPTRANTMAYLTYSNDTIYDTIRTVNQTVIEVDTFVTDLRGFITTTYMQGNVTGYSYLGKLLTRITKTDLDYSLFTSYNGNFIKQNPSLPTVHTMDYTYNIDMANRPGDYLQLLSMARYGFNFYQNKNLLRSVVDSGQTLSLTYIIDADSKITKTTAVVTDTAIYPLSTKVFDIQYEKY